MTITNAQIRMARAGLKMTVRQLADLAGCTKDTISRVEKSGVARQATLEKIQEVLENAGVELIPENGGGAGVRLKHTGEDNEPA